jgi:uncharacterized protein with NRDE domain
MCILFIALEEHADYPLIIAANRDEYFARASEPMHVWPDQPEILAGRDTQAGGTWLGINTKGQFAAVTNFRDMTTIRKNARSRGELVTRFLSKNARPQTIQIFHQFLSNEHHRYNPFNLIYGDIEAVWAWGHKGQHHALLHPGFHSVSNGPIDQVWPKMSRGVEKLTQYIRDSQRIASTQLLEIMRDSTQAEIEQLPDTGVDTNRERQLSSIFVRGGDYGTRTTTLLKFSRQRVEITECNYSPEGKAIQTNQLSVEVT